ncbi:MAG: tRNA guanosine(34) transglycosylase Tgt [Thermoanaerobaculia bacterium]
MHFEILARDAGARRGRLTTARGEIDTPAFMPVGTLGAVKGLTPQELEAAGAQIMLANLYHLSLRPGIETIARAGGAHRFTGWNRPILTDSGGFQVFSLAALRKVDERGVRFRSHLDGALLELTPESVVLAQEAIGVDIAMVLDECPPWPVTEPVAAAALARTLRWAERSVTARTTAETALFGIVQGSSFRSLREAGAQALAALPFDGYAIGGVSVGEPLGPRRAAIEWTAPLLPTNRPRYLMGVGTIPDMLHAMSHGVDLFDCVLPARNGRHGLLYTRGGALRIKNARFRDDTGPLDPECSCPVCSRLSRGFLHHLFRAGELSAAVFGTLHNLRVFLDFMGEARDAIAAFRVADLARKWTSCSADEHRSENPVAEESQ